MSPAERLSEQRRIRRNWEFLERYHRLATERDELVAALGRVEDIPAAVEALKTRHDRVRTELDTLARDCDITNRGGVYDQT